jgi:N-acetylneuraminate synthase
MNKILVIGEIGINHNGSLETAIDLINECKNAGVDVVKFQKRNPDICVPEDQKSKLRDTPWGKMSYLEYKKKIEFEQREYNFIEAHCKKIGIQWTASVWDIPSFHFINSYNVPYIKIPSASITDKELLMEINKKSIKPIMISTGMSTLEEIKQCVSTLQDKIDSVLLCNSSYPSDYSEIDLNAMSLLRDLFPGLKVGYSGHEMDILPSILACGAGAQIIERHVTLDKNMWGTDHKSSLDITQLKELVSSIRKAEIVMGERKIMVYEKEKEMLKKLRKQN